MLDVLPAKDPDLRDLRRTESGERDYIDACIIDPWGETFPRYLTFSYEKRIV